ADIRGAAQRGAGAGSHLLHQIVEGSSTHWATNPMTTVPYIPAYPVPQTYLNASYRVRSWLLTVDHKRIAILYMLGITFFFFLGGWAAVMIRLELMTPKGDLMESTAYNKMFTMHGVMMVFFFL